MAHWGRCNDCLWAGSAQQGLISCGGGDDSDEDGDGGDGDDDSDKDGHGGDVDGDAHWGRRNDSLFVGSAQPGLIRCDTGSAQTFSISIKIRSEKNQNCIFAILNCEIMPLSISI